jgi:hypothetical protein
MLSVFMLNVVVPSLAPRLLHKQSTSPTLLTVMEAVLA